jgi:hypothetical protein
MTFGPGVPQDAIYPARLRALLAAEGSPIDVVAAGVQGWNTIEEERFLAANIAPLAPDLVLLLYVSNDDEPHALREYDERPAPTSSQRLHRALALHSRLYEWALFVYKARIGGPNWAALRVIAQRRKAREAAGPAFSPDEPGWLASRAALGRLHALAQAHGARFAVLVYNLGRVPPAPTALERLLEWGVETGVPVFDTAPFFAGHDHTTLVNNRYLDPHPNPSGHALLAAGIARVLREYGLLPPTGHSRARATSR